MKTRIVQRGTGMSTRLAMAARELAKSDPSRAVFFVVTDADWWRRLFSGRLFSDGGYRIVEKSQVVNSGPRGYRNLHFVFDHDVEITHPLMRHLFNQHHFPCSDGPCCMDGY